MTTFRERYEKRMEYRKNVLRVLAAVSAVVLGSGASIAAPAPFPPLGGVRIDALAHSADRPLRAGDRLVVTLRGTAGGAAAFQIFGVARDVRMRSVRAGVYQAQPAIYTGTYTIQPGDAARQARLWATLTVGGRAAVAIGTRPVTIDTRPPAVSDRYPAPGTSLTNIRPNLVATFQDEVSGVDPATVKLLVNGRNVTARASVSGRIVSYNPAAPFSPGRVRVQLVVADKALNVHRTAWAFSVEPGGAGAPIKSVTLNPATPLTAGDLLTVVMTGLPGGVATFSIRGIPGDVSMRESGSSGLYFGTLAIRSGQVLVNAPVLVSHQIGGRIGRATASVGVTIVATSPPDPIRLTSASPTPDDAVSTASAVRTGTRLVLRGRSVAGFQVLGRISQEAGASAPQQVMLGEFSTVTGATGVWQHTIDPVVVPSGVRLLVSLVVIDPAGRESAPSVIEVGG